MRSVERRQLLRLRCVPLRLADGIIDKGGSEDRLRRHRVVEQSGQLCRITHVRMTPKQLHRGHRRRVPSHRKARQCRDGARSAAVCAGRVEGGGTKAAEPGQRLSRQIARQEEEGGEETRVRARGGARFGEEGKDDKEDYVAFGVQSLQGKVPPLLLKIGGVIGPETASVS